MVVRAMAGGGEVWQRESGTAAESSRGRMPHGMHARMRRMHMHACPCIRAHARLLVGPVAGQAANKQLAPAVLDDGTNDVQIVQRERGVGLGGGEQHGGGRVIVCGAPDLRAPGRGREV